MPRKGLRSNDGNSFIRRKVMVVVFENKQIQSGNQAVRLVAGNQVHLLVFQSSREQAKIHDSRRLGKAQTVSCRETFVAVRTLHEFITKPCPPLRRVSRGLGNGLQSELSRILTANLDGESIVK